MCYNKVDWKIEKETENLSPSEKIAKTTEDQREELKKTHKLQQKLRRLNRK